jgi:hypothetical protein
MLGGGPTWLATPKIVRPSRDHARGSVMYRPTTTMCPRVGPRSVALSSPKKSFPVSQAIREPSGDHSGARQRTSDSCSQIPTLRNTDPQLSKTKMPVDRATTRRLATGDHSGSKPLATRFTRRSPGPCAIVTQAAFRTFVVNASAFPSHDQLGPETVAVAPTRATVRVVRRVGLMTPIAWPFADVSRRVSTATHRPSGDHRGRRPLPRRRRFFPSARTDQTVQVEPATPKARLLPLGAQEIASISCALAASAGACATWRTCCPRRT